jgi:hypothetical protein
VASISRWELELNRTHTASIKLEEFELRSNLISRMVVGFIGITLPTALFLVDWFFLRRPAAFKGSISAYYHTPARDLFVAGLCVNGVALLTYFVGETKKIDFWLSALAGFAVIVVAFAPTMRPDSTLRQTQLQEAFGERAVATVHYISAAIFILSLAAICFFPFARREKEKYNHEGRAQLHRVFGVLILMGILWIGIGNLLDAEILGLTPLYLGEIVAVYAFGSSWTLMAWDSLQERRRLLAPSESAQRGQVPGG